MQLLLKRDQKQANLFSLIPLRIGSGVTFLLNAELELTPEESDLLIRYKLASAPLVISDPIDDIKQSLRPATLLGIIAFIIGWVFFSWSTAAMLSMAVIVVMTIVYFKTLREHIDVRDLRHGGKTFRCDSIVLLIQKEAYLEYISTYLRQVLESAKHWNDREAIDIPPLDKSVVKQAVLKML